jgi:hypothetical protein
VVLGDGVVFDMQLRRVLARLLRHAPGKFGVCDRRGTQMSRRKEPSVVVHVRVPARMREDLHKLAEDEGTLLSRIVRRALITYIAGKRMEKMREDVCGTGTVSTCGES